MSQLNRQISSFTDTTEDGETDTQRARESPDESQTEGGLIPHQLAEYPLIRVCRPDCQSHNPCNSEGKRPVTAADDPEPNTHIRSWIARDGNYGVVPTTDNDLVVFDVDSAAMAEVLGRKLPPTFTVQSGGADFGQHWYYQCDPAADQRNWDEPEGGVRTDNWMCVAPGSVHAETGATYEILTDADIATISHDDYRTVYELLTEIDDLHADTTTVETTGGSQTNSSPESPPESSETPESLSFIASTESQRKIADILQNPDAPHRDRLWLAGWLYGAAGLKPAEIISLLNQEARWSDYDPEITRSQVESIPDTTDSERAPHPSKSDHISTTQFAFLQSEP